MVRFFPLVGMTDAPDGGALDGFKKKLKCKGLKFDLDNFHRY